MKTHTSYFVRPLRLGLAAFGAVLMAIRSRHAVTAFVVSLVTAAVSFAWQFSAGIVTTPVLPLVILAAILFFWWYATKMRGEGVLR